MQMNQSVLRSETAQREGDNLVRRSKAEVDLTHRIPMRNPLQLHHRMPTLHLRAIAHLRRFRCRPRKDTILRHRIDKGLMRASAVLAVVTILFGGGGTKMREILFDPRMPACAIEGEAFWIETHRRIDLRDNDIDTNFRSNR